MATAQPTLKTHAQTRKPTITNSPLLFSSGPTANWPARYWASTVSRSPSTSRCSSTAKDNRVRGSVFDRQIRQHGTLAFNAVCEGPVTVSVNSNNSQGNAPATAATPTFSSASAFCAGVALLPFGRFGGNVCKYAGAAAQMQDARQRGPGAGAQGFAKRLLLARAGNQKPDFAGGGNGGVAEGDAQGRRFAGTADGQIGGFALDDRGGALGKREATWPSSPMPRKTRSRTGWPALFVGASRLIAALASVTASSGFSSPLIRWILFR